MRILHLFRQPFGLTPSPKGKALAGSTDYNLAHQHHGNDTERGAPRSESKISMIASGNHTTIFTQECNEYRRTVHEFAAGRARHALSATTRRRAA